LGVACSGGGVGGVTVTKQVPPYSGPFTTLPTIPVGIDAIRAWDQWPLIRIGQRTYMRSTFDRAGSNYDSSHFIRRTGADLVTLDVKGSGVLTFFRTNHWHGSPWTFISDGQATVVEDQSTADPDHPIRPSTFLPADLFPAPIAPTFTATAGADLSWVPIPFADSYEIRYGRSKYGTGYYIYSQYAEGASNLSQTPQTWTKEPPPADIVALFGQTAADLTPGTPVATTGASAQDFVGPGVLRYLAFDVPETDAAAFANARLQITWDDRPLPSVDAPIGLFFGTGTLARRDTQPDLVHAFPFTIRFANGRVSFTSIFPMPFSSHAHVALVGSTSTDVRWSARIDQGRPAAYAYFHATYRDIPTPTPKMDNVLLDTTADEGGGDWCGSFIGNSFTFTDTGDLTTLEGDPRFFFDDSDWPQAQGTGTEEWGGGGDYWENGARMTMAFAGHPVGTNSGAAKNADELVNSAYRVLLADAMPFGKNARIQLEHGEQNLSPEHYRSVAYWYGNPGACLNLVDTLDVGNVPSELAHSFATTVPAPPQSVTSSYELGTVFPQVTDDGRVTSGSLTFRLTIPPENVGILLRRRLDYGIPDQTATVEISDDADGAPFVSAGTWYTAGSTAVVVNDAKEETGTAPDVIVTSPNRWRNEEIILAQKLTEGRKAIRVRITSPTWSAFHYWAYAWRLP
jgi:hypothetical protein